jgi:hypothetical protein
MAGRTSFRFVDDDLNRKLIRLLTEARAEFRLDCDGVVHYSPRDEDLIGNDLISSVRADVFRAWQIVTCPPEWIGSYKDYMEERGVPFTEELSNGQLWFLIPRNYRPHSWKLKVPASGQRA